MFRELSFVLRDRLFGRLRLRGPVPLSWARESENEIWFYGRLLAECSRSMNGAPTPDAVWDVGCRNGSYLGAIHRAFPRARITGLEVDLGRRYLNLHRRADVADAYAARLREKGVDCRVENADIRNYERMTLRPGERSGLALYFFPFVSEDPCRAWGLPERFARFEEWLEPVVASRGAVGCFSVHQGEWEAAEAARAYQARGLEIRTGHISSREWEGRWPLKWDAHWFLNLPARSG